MNDIALTLKIYKINKHATEEEGVAIVYLVRELNGVMLTEAFRLIF